MAFVLPQLATVRPRVVVSDAGDTRPLDDVVGELVDDRASGVWRLIGGPGSGKSTALSHLAAVFHENPRLIFLDAPTQIELKICSPHALVVASLPRSKKDVSRQLVLAEWGRDEIIEYALVKNRAACGSVVARLSNAAQWEWPPMYARVVVDRFAEDPEADDPIVVLVDFVRQQIPNAALFRAVCRFCFVERSGGGKELVGVIADIKKFGGQEHSADMLFLNDRVRMSLAAEYLVGQLSSGKPVCELERRLPLELVELVARKCSESPKASRHLHGCLAAPRHEAKHPMAASILHTADQDWRPKARRGHRWNFARAHLQGAQWPSIKLRKASLLQTDLSGALLSYSDLREALASAAKFSGADLQHANMLGIEANGAHFVGAYLPGARLAKAQLNQADLTRADLTSAAMMFADLRHANLTDACFFRADLTAAQFEQARMENSNFSFATLNCAIERRRLATSKARWRFL